MMEVAWWEMLAIMVLTFIGGYIVSFFVFRKNPKYLNIDKLIIENIKERRAEVIKSIQEKAKELK